MSFSINHCTCGHHPQLKLLESNLWIVKCGHCKQFAEPWITELGAISRWNRAQVDRVCLGCKSLPKAVYLRESQRWIMACRNCLYQTSPCMTLDGAMVGWTIHNRPNDPTTFNLWHKRFEAIKEG